MLPSKAGVRASPPGTYSWGIYTQSTPRLTQPPVSWKRRQMRPTRHEDTRGQLPQPHSFSLGSSSCSLHLPVSLPPLELLCWDVLRLPRQEHWLKSARSECLWCPHKEYVQDPKGPHRLGRVCILLLFACGEFTTQVTSQYRNRQIPCRRLHPRLSVQSPLFLIWADAQLSFLHQGPRAKNQT